MTVQLSRVREDDEVDVSKASLSVEQMNVCLGKAEVSVSSSCMYQPTIYTEKSSSFEICLRRRVCADI